jgi:glycosyltransferase involved in cell wall biosynthesis
VNQVPVSVVIPAWESAAFVESAVRSALAQSAAPVEVVVVDDASGDQTAERARAAGATVIQHASNEGVGKSRNDGIAAARGEWVALLDADDEWLPHHLETLWSAREGHVLVSAAAVTFGDDAAPRALGWARRRARRLDSPAKAAVPENPIRTSGVMFRRADALAVGGFREEQRRAQDLDMWLRLLERGTGIALPVVTSRYRVHEAQVSADRPTGWAAQRAILAAYADRPWCTAALRRQRDAAIAWDEARAGGGYGRFIRAAADPRAAYAVALLLANRRAQRRLGRQAGSKPSTRP